ncbi:MAG: FtsQ-type POTRA domain-containing protein [Verrucomicrobiota bacterium]
MIRHSSPTAHGNRRHRPAGSGQHLLNVKVRAVTARRQRRQKVGSFFWVSALLVIVCLTAWLGIATALDKFFFSNPDYTLKHVTLELDGVMTREEALAEAGIREGENIFRVDLTNAEKALRAVPQVGDVNIERRLPDHISITVTARHAVAWVAPLEKDADPFDPEKSLLVDETGYLMKPRIIQPEFYHLPVIYGVQSDNIRDGEPLHNEDLHRALALLDEAARHPEDMLNIVTMNISKGYCVEVLNDRNARITFSTDDYPEQLGRLRQLLEHCRDTGRELDSVNLMVRRNTPVTFVMAPPATEKLAAPSQRTAQSNGGRKH